MVTKGTIHDSNILDLFHEEEETMLEMSINNESDEDDYYDDYEDDYDDYDSGYEWTDEDSWDAMTDGQYGDYPGSDWDPEMFGY